MEIFWGVVAVLGIFGLMLTLIILAAWLEDLETDAGSQSNPNSQVQLAPQVGHAHRIFNKAISGEPASHSFFGAIAGTFFMVSWGTFHLHPVISLAIAGGFTVFFLATFAMVPFIARNTSHNVFGQPLYLDVLHAQLPIIVAYGFMCSTLYVTLAYLFYAVALSPLNIYIGYPFPIPIGAFMFGLMAGSIGSSVGDVHYGTERLFQHLTFGEGIAMKDYGNIDVKAELGYRTSADIDHFCAKLAGPLTGFCFALIILFDNLTCRLTLGLPLLTFGIPLVILSVIVGVIALILLFFANRIIEVWARKKFGPYEG